MIPRFPVAWMAAAQ